ncbi:hypothetical protein KAX17_01800 [Candidatus Bipolaricaulota bacterium]|nr:hypothetical protein [Candidatus Bipolaricaulota bacterium]
MKLRQRVALASLLAMVFVVCGCLPLVEDIPPGETSGDALIEYMTYETTSLGPYPIHQARENEKFVVLDMLITNTHSWKNFPIHRLYFFLATETQRFSTGYGASSMPDLRYPIANNSEILPGKSARHMTFFRVPEYVTEYEFEYDNYGKVVIWREVSSF